MNKKNVQKLLLTLPFFVVSMFGPGLAQAEELTISGNGSDADSTVSVSQSNNTNITQSNDADVDNNIDVTANTGDNSASDNTGGDTAITTGNVQITTDVATQANTSVITQGCCPTSGENKAVISGNGSGSSNNINISNSSNVNINVDNDASIRNLIRGYASTGGNSASDNTNGDVSIDTGDIEVLERIRNKANYSNVKFGLPNELDYIARIFGNGSWSDNEISFDNESNVDVDVDNDADVDNRSIWDLVTGDNEADDNTNGDVRIKTGDIKYESEIVNDVNKSVVEVGCCEEKEEEEEKPPAAPAPSSPKPGEKSSQASPDNKPAPSKEGQVLGEAMGKILPATGSNWLFFAILGNVAMLLIGMFLRLRSGRSPGFSIGL